MHLTGNQRWRRGEGGSLNTAVGSAPTPAKPACDVAKTAAPAAAAAATPAAAAAAAPAHLDESSISLLDFAGHQHPRERLQRRHLRSGRAFGPIQRRLRGAVANRFIRAAHNVLGCIPAQRYSVLLEQANDGQPAGGGSAGVERACTESNARPWACLADIDMSQMVLSQGDRTSCAGTTRMARTPTDRRRTSS